MEGGESNRKPTPRGPRPRSLIWRMRFPRSAGRFDFVEAHDGPPRTSSLHTHADLRCLGQSPVLPDLTFRIRAIAVLRCQLPTNNRVKESVAARPPSGRGKINGNVGLKGHPEVPRLIDISRRDVIPVRELGRTNV